MQKKLIVISGPTGAGKTDLAIEVAEYFNTEIISADSRQLFRGLKIGTAQPSAVQLKTIKHHLVNCYPVTQEYNAGVFEKESMEILAGIFRTKDTAVVCGGTGLYIDALLYGMDDLPPSDPALRKQLNDLYNDKGIEFLQKEIKEKDPEFASVADLNNPQRMIRALEVFKLTGKKFSSYHSGKKASRDFDYYFYALLPERNDLYRNINARTDKMFAHGFIDEAKSMLPYKSCNALKTVGYKELFEYLEDKMNLEETIDKIKQHTRNYDKRQLTWLRKNPDVCFTLPEKAFEKIISDNSK
jgi:tRNA dimethylallyltransferase